MKISLQSVANLENENTAVAQINSNSTIISQAFDNTLSLDGTLPNSMGSNFDMNSHQILNLPSPATANSPLRLQDLVSFTGGGTIASIPAGGTTGQVLTKINNTDFNTGWSNSVTSVGLSLPADFTISNSPVTTTGTLTAVWATTPTGTGAVVRAVSPTITGHPTVEGVTSTGATGTGNYVFSTSPTLTTPALGVPTSVTLTNATGLPISGLSGLATGVSTFLATPSSSNLAAAITDETGTGSLVFATSPTLITPALGTPASGVATNLTGTASGLTAGHVTTNANLTGPITSSGNATSVAAQTGTGSTFVMNTSPSLVTPLLGTPTSGLLTNCTGLPLSTGVTGNLPVGNLNSGTSASASTFWRGDGSWASPSGGGNVTGPGVAVSGNIATYNGTTGTIIQDSGLAFTGPTSWTPVVTAATPGNLSITYSAQIGSYVKIGKLVTATFNITTSAFTYTTASGSILITGLPFAANSTAGLTFSGSLSFSNWTHAGYTSLAPLLISGASSLNLFASGSSSTGGSDVITSFPTGGTLTLTGTITYFTN